MVSDKKTLSINQQKISGTLESVSDLDLPLFLKSLLRLYEVDGYDKDISQVVITKSRNISLSPINYQLLIRTLKATRKELRAGDESLKAINSMIWLKEHYQINQKAVITLIRKIIEYSENPKAVAVAVKRLAKDLKFPMSKVISSDKRLIRSTYFEPQHHLKPEDLSRILSLMPTGFPLKIVEVLISYADSLHSGLISLFDKGTDTEVIMDFVKETIRSVNMRILETIRNSNVSLTDSEAVTLTSEVERVFEKIMDSALDQYVLITG